MKPAVFLCASLALTVANAEVVLRVVHQSGSETNLLRNPGFEQYQAEQLTAWSNAPRGFRVAAGEGRAGSVALACNASGDQGWYGASQTISLSRTNLVPLVIRGWSKAENVSGGVDSGYSLYVDVLYQDGTPLWGRTASFRIGTHDWEEREFVVSPEKPVRTVTVNCIFRGHAGKVWFDDIQVSEAMAPSGAVLFQGVPMTVGLSTPPPSGTVTRYSTKDGLTLGVTGGRINALEVDGRSLAGTAASGFLARDVAANSDLFRFAGSGDCPELGLRLQTTITVETNHLVVQGRISDTTRRDRAILLAFALPIDASGWNWGDDIRQTRKIEAGGEFANLAMIHSGSMGSQSIYPVGCIHDKRSGLALAIDMGRPAQYRLLYHAGTKQLLIVYDFGLVQETEQFPSSADFRFVLYRFEPAWGFRAAFEKLMEIFPDYFVVRSRDQGIWMPFTDVSKVEGWRDFGFRYHEGNNNVLFDDEHGILSFRYTEPMTWWMSMGPELPRDEASALRVRDELASAANGSRRRMAEVSRAAAMTDADGHPALLFRNEPWANGAVWSLNPNPRLPADPNAGTVHWSESIRDQLYGARARGKLDGEYLDSLEGYVTADLNFRREHFRYSTVPLTFDTATHKPALAKGLGIYEFTRWISEDLHRMGKLCFANGVPYRFGFLCPWLDLMGTETDWLSGNNYRPASHSQMAVWRTLAGRKPYLLLMNTDYERFGPELVERYFRRSLFYGMFPSMFSHNASENPYWLNPKWYNRDRSLFRKYLPVIKQVAEAGWQPVTGAICDNPHILVERFGPSVDGFAYYTLLNETSAAQSGGLRETRQRAGDGSEGAATEMLTGKALEWNGTSWKVELAPQAAGVVRVKGGGPISSAAIE